LIKQSTQAIFGLVIYILDLFNFALFILFFLPDK
jgi:hypothetical protein